MAGRVCPCWSSSPSEGAGPPSSRRAAVGAGAWRCPATTSGTTTFWRQLLRSLVTSTEGPVRLTSDRSNYADEARIALRAEVRRKDYEHAENAQVTVVVTPELGEPSTVEMRPSATEPGVYEAEVGAESLGVYRVEATARLGDERLGADTLHLRREGGVAEFFHPERNGSLLARLADGTGGRYWGLDELDDLPGDIRFSEAGITTREVLDLWDMPALFLLLLMLRAAEWLVRKRGGVV